MISLDSFAAAVGLGTREARARFARIAMVFGVVGGAFPVVGLLLGRSLSGFMGAWASLLAGSILIGLGIWLTVAARGAPARAPLGHPRPRRRPLQGAALLGLAAGLSTDNLVAGFALGLHGADTILLGLLTFLSVLLASLLGLHLGAAGQARLGARAGALTGLLLMAFGVWILLSGLGMGSGPP